LKREAASAGIPKGRGPWQKKGEKMTAKKKKGQEGSDLKGKMSEKVQGEFKQKRVSSKIFKNSLLFAVYEAGSAGRQ